ncbi:MAG: undecaprenyl-diphosphatase UppP [Nitrospirota bacterium]|nr:undecaprenyl-diphosphatase UppP [Nitrospirota bacterium]
MSTILEAVILGIVQGLTEFLPISSSGHLILAQWATGWEGELINSLTFDVALHVGTLTAVLWYFWRDWLQLGKATVKALQGKAPQYEARLVWYIGLATIPAVIAGLTLERTIETLFRNPLLVAAALVVGSVLMWYADKYSKRERFLGTMTLRHALFVGVAQAFALVPGVSRSGITITAALAAGYRREDAARFSFLLSTPVIAGAAVLKLRHLTFQGHAAWGCILGTLGSAVVGYLAIRFLIRYLGRHSLDVFVWYRLALAALVVVYWSVK